MVQSLSPGEGLLLCSRGENSLTHILDPCWNRCRRLLAEEEDIAAPVGGSKTGREKPLENRVSAIIRKLNLKWS